ncbi:MAG: glycosyltransferase family 2 protein [Acidobacteria bacterium]|nr:glycosyltransferase family 2 protein [Acidobacteriota bacterium]MCA1637661.1 glycosyltransferase family 2 protein [Acidobacteriota bacterium]
MPTVDLISAKQTFAPFISSGDVEVSIVIPCLDEEDTLEYCLQKAQKAIEESGIRAEIIVADNDSIDNSAAIAQRNGARVVLIKEKGYGHALMGGIAAAKGNFIVMGDADDSYDFTEISKFIEKLRDNFDFVLGCRFPKGGGEIATNSMPFLHRWIGNPLFSLLVRRWYRVPVHDVYCGFRGFTREFYEKLDMQCTGMEFAIEMVIKSSFQNARIAEIPITLYPDRRVSHSPHLRTFRDGWRTVRFILMYSPRWLFLLPGILLVLLGLFVFAFSQFKETQNAEIENNFTIVRTLMFASLAILCGYQSILFAIFTKTFAISEGLLPEDKRFLQFFEIVTLERGLTAAFAALIFGIIFLITGFSRSSLLFFDTLHLFFFGATLIAIGFQTILSGFFTSILGMKRK